MTISKTLRTGGLFATLALAAAAPPVGAQSYGEYTVDELLNACVEGDNYSFHEAGERAELQCNFYLRGFADAALELAPEGKFCLPTEGDYVGSLRRSFMQWGRTHPDTSDWPAIRGAMEAFSCP